MNARTIEKVVENDLLGHGKGNHVPTEIRFKGLICLARIIGVVDKRRDVQCVTV